MNSDHISLVEQLHDAFARGELPAVLRDGKIRSFQQFTDTAQCAKAARP